MENIKKSLKRNYIFNLIYNMTNLLIPLLIAPYLSRILETDGVGIKSYTLSIVSNFILFATLGTSEYGQREISRYRDDNYQCSKKMLEIGILRIITTGIALVVYIPSLVLNIINFQNNVIYFILIINILANAIDFSWFLRGHEEFKTIAYVQIISKIFMLIFTFVCVKSKNDINVAILINSLSILISSILPLFVLRKYYIKVRMRELNPYSHLKDCLLYFVPAIAIQIYTVLDKTMIGIITNSSYENGYYEQADKIVKILITIVTTTNSIMNSRISYLYEKSKKDDISRLIKKSTSLCMLIAVPITFGIIAVSDMFIPIYFGEGYEKTSYLVIILAPLAIIIGISGLLGSHYYTPLGKRRQSNKYLITGSIINLCLNFLLIKNLKSIGAAISSVLAELVITILYIVNCDKTLFNFKMLVKLSYKYFISAVIMTFLLFIVKSFCTLEIKSLIILIGTGICIYILLIILFRDKYVVEQFSEIKEKIKNGRVRR